jgi:hypothetical protein
VRGERGFCLVSGSCFREHSGGEGLGRHILEREWVGSGRVRLGLSCLLACLLRQKKWTTTGGAEGRMGDGERFEWFWLGSLKCIGISAVVLASGLPGCFDPANLHWACGGGGLVEGSRGAGRLSASSAWVLWRDQKATHLNSTDQNKSKNSQSAIRVQQSRIHFGRVSI